MWPTTWPSLFVVLLASLSSSTQAFGYFGSASAPPLSPQRGCRADVESTFPPLERRRASGRRRTSVGMAKTKFKNFDEMLAVHHDDLVLVAWNARYCGPCRLMKKELRRVRGAFGDEVLVFNVDTERFPSLGARYKVAGLPTILLFRKGVPIHRIEGVEDANEIIRQVRNFL